MATTIDEQCDPPKSRFGRFLMVSLLAATSVIAGVRRHERHTYVDQIQY
jgi:hypothetical protein